MQNQFGLLGAARNLDFFTSFYRYLIQLLPAAVVAPLFFAGKIEFGVINQSQSAFNHILNDVSLVVYQIQAIAGFSAVVDRLGEFSEVRTAICVCFFLFVFVCAYDFRVGVGGWLNCTVTGQQCDENVWGSCW